MSTATFNPALFSETATPSAPVAETTRKPRVWTVFVTWLMATVGGVLAVFVAFVSAGLVAGIVMGAQGVAQAEIQTRIQAALQQPTLALFLTLIPFQLGMASVVLLAAWRSKTPLKQRIGLVPQTGRIVSGLKAASLGAFTLSSALIFLIGVVMLTGNAQASGLGDVLNDGSWLTVTLLGIVLSMIPAVVEEVLFRGYMQRRMLQRWSPAVAIGVSTLLFAILHCDSLLHILAVVPLGIVTGLLAHRTNSIKPGIVVHALHNAGTVAFVALVRVLTPLMGEETAGLLMIAVIAILALAGLPGIISLLRGAKSKAGEVSPAAADQAAESLASQAA